MTSLLTGRNSRRLLAGLAVIAPMLAGGEGQAQVRKPEERPARTATAPRHSAPPRTVKQPVQVGNHGGNRVNGNVNIGNDITVAAPRRGGAVVVPVYPGYASGPSVGAVVATGVIAGATAGLVSGAMQQSNNTTVVQGATTPPGTTLEVGMRLATLPNGCTTQRIGQTTYYRCGSAWLQAFMEGSQVVYLVVPTP
jgi:cell wall-associated NlpC family hydrolase